MGVGSGLYMYNVLVNRSCSLSHLLMSSCYTYVPLSSSSITWYRPWCGDAVQALNQTRNQTQHEVYL